MALQRSIFVGGAVANGIREAQATHIFDLMEKFAGYGFNKSHSAAYAVLTYQTAWLKTHYPADYMAAVLSADMDRTDKVVGIIDECRALGLDVLPPDANASEYRFAVADATRIRYGLGAVKGVGEAAVEALAATRRADGPFGSLSDLCRRVDLGRVNRRCLEALLRAGCFDRLGPNRATLMAELPRALKLGEQKTRADSIGQVDLFGLAPVPAAGANPGATAPVVATLPEWTQAVRLAGERETLGLFLTGHPIDEYLHDLRYLAPGSIAELTATRPAGESRWPAQRSATVAGLVLEIRRRGNRTSLILDDRSGRLEVSLFDEVFQQHRELIVRDAILIVEGSMRWDDFLEDWRLAARKLTTIEAAREAEARRLLLRWPAGGDAAALMRLLEASLAPVRGGRCSVALYYPGPVAHALLELGAEWRVRPTRALLEDLARHFGADGWQLVYHARDQEARLAAWGTEAQLAAPPLRLAG